MQWRHTAGGYLREVLTAKVYDVAVETPLEAAEKLRYAPGGLAAQHGQPAAGACGPPAAAAEAASACVHWPDAAACRRACSPALPAPLLLTTLSSPSTSPLNLLCCSEACGNTILLKREDLQPVKSFKLRGAYNKMAQLTEEQVRAWGRCWRCAAGRHAKPKCPGRKRASAATTLAAAGCGPCRAVC